LGPVKIKSAGTSGEEQPFKVMRAAPNRRREVWVFLNIRIPKSKKVSNRFDGRLSSTSPVNQAEKYRRLGGMRTLGLGLLAGLVFLCGCAGSGGPRSNAGRADRYLISQEQIQAQPAGTAMDIVERLQRDWLTGRSATLSTNTGRSYPHVFVDGRPYGPVDVLLSLGTETIDHIRFIPPSDATTRYGTGYPAGIIEVVTKRDL
jgi:hypothetical protein